MCLPKFSLCLISSCYGRRKRVKKLLQLKKLCFIDKKFYFKARFIDEIANSNIEHKSILTAAKTILNGPNLTIEDLLMTSDDEKKQRNFFSI